MFPKPKTHHCGPSTAADREKEESHQVEDKGASGTRHRLHSGCEAASWQVERAPGPEAGLWKRLWLLRERNSGSRPRVRTQGLLRSGPAGARGADKHCVSEAGRSQATPDVLGEDAGTHQFIIHTGVRDTREENQGITPRFLRKLQRCGRNVRALHTCVRGMRFTLDTCVASNGTQRLETAPNKSGILVTRQKPLGNSVSR